MTTEEEKLSSLQMLQEALAAVASAKEEVDRLLRESVAVGSEVAFTRDGWHLRGTVAHYGFDGTIGVRLVDGTNQERRVAAAEVDAGQDLRDALSMVDGAKKELARILREEYPVGMSVVFVRGGRRLYGRVETHGDDGSLQVRTLESNPRKSLRRVLPHAIRA